MDYGTLVGGKARGGIDASVCGVQANEAQVMATLYSLYAVRLRRYVGRMVEDEHDAEDVVQSVFVKLMRSLDRYEDRGHRFDAWIFRVARNAALDHLRVRSRCEPVAELFPEPASRHDAGWDASMDLHNALSEMPAGERRLLLMRHVMGMSSGEIAEALGRTVSSVDSGHHRARHRLRRRLEADGPAPLGLRPAA